MSTSKNQGPKPQTEQQKTPGAPVPATRPAVRWDASQLTSAYANVANVATSRDEIVMTFGVNQAWREDQPEVTIQLTHRLILTPSTARRLCTILAKSIADFDKRVDSVEGQNTNGVAA